MGLILRGHICWSPFQQVSAGSAGLFQAFSVSERNRDMPFQPADINAPIAAWPGSRPAPVDELRS